MKYHTFENFAALSEALSQQWLDVIQTTPTGSSASFALAGGSTPAPVYQRLDQLLADVDQHQPIKLVATDERWVPDQDKQSNEGLFRRCLSASATDKRWQLVSLKNAANTPEVAAEAIHARLNEQLPQAFSAVLLGMGADGHIASLFPGAPTQHDDLACLAAVHPQTRQSRMSLSLPRLLNTKRIWLVITGAEKRQVLDQAIENNLPVASLLREAGCTIDVFWCP
ncbi:6-phosphogluconolactonase [Undibacterium sp. Ji50W]